LFSTSLSFFNKSSGNAQPSNNQNCHYTYNSESDG
jgi:hypothetical protein